MSFSALTGSIDALCGVDDVWREFPGWNTLTQRQAKIKNRDAWDILEFGVGYVTFCEEAKLKFTRKHQENLPPKVQRGKIAAFRHRMKLPVWIY